MRNEYGRDLTKGKVFSNLIVLALPIFLVLLLTMGYQIINSIWIGNMLGKDALASATVSLSILSLLISVATGSTLAISILISQTFGKKDHEMVKKIVDNSIYFFIIVSVIITVVFIIGSNFFLKVMGASDEILGMASTYLRLSMVGFLAIYLFDVVNAILNGVGDVKTPLKILVLSTVINAVLDPILISRFGLKGAAFASLISQVAALIAGIIYINKKGDLLSIKIKRFTFDKEIIIKLVKIGFPSLIQQCLLPLSSLFITALVASYGSESIAAFGAAGKIDYFAIIPAMAIGNAVSIMAGQNIGAGLYDRVKEIFKNAIKINLLINLIIALVVFFMPKILLRMFAADPHVLNIGANYLKIVCFGYILFAISFVTNGIINGSGKTIITMLISFLSLCIIRVPIAIFLSHNGFGLNGIWIAILISYAVTSVNSSLYYLLGKWRKVALDAAA
ncbi:MATE family efflux transporter [Clostridium sp. C8-1-8]|uniref:MATE family efflux transporter n=1 Tax=Clostridium sp. C8-1-8 TaxID=2698831 RepID=UPI00136990ED|nr:MATE family efflux transporter [Clostridium sp. C8-1-8]